MFLSLQKKKTTIVPSNALSQNMNRIENILIIEKVIVFHVIYV